VAHETVWTPSRATTILPVRLPAVVEEGGVVDELLAPTRSITLSVLADLDARVQFLG
jgi:hypothetical protein